MTQARTHYKKWFVSPFFWIIILYTLTAKGHLEVIDTAYSLRTAEAIIDHGSMRIEAVDHENIKFSVNPSTDGKVYSQYGIGLPFLFIPFVLVGRLISSILSQPSDVVVGFVLSFYNVPFAILGLYFIRKILLKLGSGLNRANATIALIAMGTFYWTYSVSDFSEVTQVSFLLGALYSVTTINKNRWIIFSFWFASLVSIKLAYLAVLPIFIGLALYENRKKTSKLIITTLKAATFLLPLGAAIGFANYLRYESFFETGYGAHPGLGFGITYFLRTSMPSLFSMNSGIFIFNPILLSLIFFRNYLKIKKVFFLLCIGITSTWFCIMCSYSYGWGWGWGQRYLFIIVPILTIFIGFAYRSKPTKIKTLLFSSLAILSCLIQIISVSTKFHEPLTIQKEATEKFKGPYSPQLPSTISLFYHKITDGSSLYPLSIIGGDENETVNLREYDSFQGLNYWPIHALKFFKKNQYIQHCSIFLFLIVSLIQFILLMKFLPLLLGTNSMDED